MVSNLKDFFKIINGSLLQKLMSDKIFQFYPEQIIAVHFIQICIFEKELTLNIYLAWKTVHAMAYT